MRRWNGWGEESTVVELPDSARGFLAELVGQGARLPDASLEAALAKVPASRLEADPRYSIDPRERLLHARGQSLPDWLAMREGDFGVYPDAVAYPETAEQIRELLALADSRDLQLIPYGGGTSVAGHCSAVAVLARIWKINDAVEMAPEDAQPIEYQRKLTRRGLGFTQARSSQTGGIASASQHPKYLQALAGRTSEYPTRRRLAQVARLSCAPNRHGTPGSSLRTYHPVLAEGH
ncbi:FAD-binding protein [Pseudomonas aeruginosa]